MSRLLRQLSLGLGVAGVVGGLTLGVIWLRTPPVAAAAAEAQPQGAIMVAAQPVAPGVLIREADIAWRPFVGGAPQGAYLKGSVTPSIVVGAAARRGFAKGEVIVASGLVRPDQRDFLSATLTPGERAVTIPVDAPQSASGLVLPGDRVDVILVQQVGEGDRRVAAETVIHNARVLAVGHTFTPDGKGASDPLNLTSPRRSPWKSACATPNACSSQPGSANSNWRCAASATWPIRRIPPRLSGPATCLARRGCVTLEVLPARPRGRPRRLRACRRGRLHPAW